MKTKLIIVDGAIIGTTTPDDPNGYHLVDAPEGFDGDLASVEFDAEAGVARLVLAGVQARRIAAIKAEAAAHLSRTDWKLDRAREREKAGWAQLAHLALTDVAAVREFAWAPDAVPVPAPRLLTHEQFIKRFTPTEWEAMTAAARASTAMDAWMRRFALASVVSLDDPATAAGVQALELAGILANGRAAEVMQDPQTEVTP
jgi:hypothetical protein